MADKKISALTAASTPLAGTEVLPIVQSGTTVKVAVSDLTAGRTPAAANFINGYTAVVSAGATTTLTATSTFVQKLSGSTTQTFQLPSASTITAGTAYLFDNDSTGLLTVTDGAGGAVTTVASGSCQYVFLETAGSTAGSWGKYAWVPVAGLPVASGGTGTTTAFTAGSVVYAGASGTYSQDNAYYFWDSTNHRLGLATTSPQRLAHLGARGAASTAGACQIQNLTIGGKYNDTSSTDQWSFISWQFTADSSDDPYSVTPGSEAGKNWYMGPVSPTAFFQNGRFALVANGSDKMSVDLSGNMQLGPTASVVTGRLAASVTGTGVVLETNGASGYYPGWFQVAGTQKGYITTTSGGTTYNTVSDYRLKENIAPMTGALDKVMALKPCTYVWKEDGSSGQGFIAHELAEIVPDCVTGEKDATYEQSYEITPAIPAVLDDEGNEISPAVEAVMGTRTAPFYQGIDTSNLVATLTAAIQELKAEFDAYKASHP